MVFRQYGLMLLVEWVSVGCWLRIIGMYTHHHLIVQRGYNGLMSDFSTFGVSPLHLFNLIPYTQGGGLTEAVLSTQTNLSRTAYNTYTFNSTACFNYMKILTLQGSELVKWGENTRQLFNLNTFNIPCALD